MRSRIFTQPLSGRFENPRMRRVRYGPGAVESLPDDIREFGGRRVLVVASGHLARETDLVAELERRLGSLHAATFVGVPQHGPRKAVLDAAALAREVEADFLVSFGGGSPIDATKLVGLCLAEGIRTVEELSRYAARFEYPDKLHLPRLNEREIPHVAISTTLSAGEFTHFAGALNEELHQKQLYVGEKLMAREVILDPAVTTHTPAWLWASSGLRAIDHCVETMLSSAHMPFTDAIAAEALSILTANLAPSARDPGNQAARGACELGAWMSLYALHNVSMGLSHAIGHQIGGRYNVTHGVTSAIMLPWVMEFNLPATEDRQIRLASAMGVEVEGLSPNEAGRAAIARLRELIRTLGLPTRLRDVGVPKEELSLLVDDTLGDALVATNPRPVDARAIRELLEKAY